jgi:NAD(P)-dependent dehydrogenase (short-subunit alcohol dehydrogenase family)
VKLNMSSTERRNTMTSVFPGVAPVNERVAIVVGAGGELGRATAEKLAAAGFTVAGVDRSEEALKELPDGIRREVADPADPAAARSVVDRIAAEAGPPEVLVNTIGTYHLGDALSVTPEDLRLMIDVNVGPALWLTQAVVPYLRDRGSGSIVHVAARPGLEQAAGMTAYAVSKAALVHLTRVLDLVSDAAAPVSGAVVPAYGA